MAFIIVVVAAAGVARVFGEREGTGEVLEDGNDRRAHDAPDQVPS